MDKRLVQDWMTKNVITVTPQTTLSQARELMIKHQIRSLLVVEDEQLVGLITRRQLFRTDKASLEEAVWSEQIDMDKETVGKYMLTNTVAISPQSYIADAAQLMHDHKVTALPVLVEGEKLTGIITSSDVFRAVIELVPTLDENILVKHYMKPSVIFVLPDTSLMEAHRLMSAENIRSLPVIEMTQPMGIITRTDLMAADGMSYASREEYLHELEKRTVREVMSSDLVTIMANQTIVEAAELMLKHKIHSILVTNEDGDLDAIITESDIFRMLVAKFPS